MLVLTRTYDKTAPDDGIRFLRSGKSVGRSHRLAQEKGGSA